VGVEVPVRTTKGYFVFDALRPFPKKMVFGSEQTLKKAKLRYAVVVGVLFTALIRIHLYLESDAPTPDWVYPEGMIAALFSPFVILPFVYLIMPEKVLYDLKFMVTW